MRGFESTVFAYGEVLILLLWPTCHFINSSNTNTVEFCHHPGQTGTGKTHTMEGSLDSPELYGVIPRSAQVRLMSHSYLYTFLWTNSNHPPNIHTGHI